MHCRIFEVDCDLVNLVTGQSLRNEGWKFSEDIPNTQALGFQPEISVSLEFSGKRIAEDLRRLDPINIEI